MIYLDNAATYVDNDEALAYFSKISKIYPANANSLHRLGFLSFKALDDAREEIKKTLKLDDSYDVIFNSSATEGINHAVKGYALANKNRGNEIVAFINEHTSTINSLKALEKKGFIITYVKCQNNGEIDYQDLENKINKNTIMVIVMAANNETGSTNDITRVATLVKPFPKCVFFSDVTQAIGKINVPYNLTDMFAFSAHKFGGLMGSGILIKKKKILLEKMLDGGDQEHGYRASTVATSLALTTTFALKNAIKNLAVHYNHALTLKSALIKGLKDIDEVVINSTHEFPYIVNFSFKHKRASVVIEALSLKEIYVSSLSACDKKIDLTSNALLNMGKDKQIAANSIRVSFNAKNTLDEIDIFIKNLKEVLGAIK